MSFLIFFGIMCMLLAVMSFFSAAETAITFGSRAKLHQMAKGGDEKAKIVLQLQSRLGLVIGVILTCLTLLSAVTVSIGTYWISSYRNYYLSAISPIIMGTVILLFAEVMPKMAVLQNATHFLRFIAPTLCFLLKFFHPFNFFIQQISKWTLRLIGFRIDPNIINEEDKDELRGVIDLHGVGGSGNSENIAQERAMLKSILDLTSVGVGEIMIHRQNVFMLNVDLPAQDITNQILACPFTRVPLWKHNPDNIIGVVHSKALIRLERENPSHNFDILSIMHEPWFIPESTNLLAQLQAFRARREHFAIVVDEYGSFMGIVTLEDLLEEIVGDITDEYDVLGGGIRAQEDGSYIIAGHVTIRDLNRQFDWNLPDEHASTIAGLLIHEFRVIPSVGQIFHFQNFRFEILRRQNNQILLVRMTHGLSES